MTTETKFEVNKWYKRGDGELIRVVCVDAPGDYPVIGCYENGNPLTYTSSGQYYADRRWVDLDLIPAPIEPKKKGVVWVNVYDDGDLGGAYDSPDEADANQYHDRIARIRVSWEEGQFDE